MTRALNIILSHVTWKTESFFRFTADKVTVEATLALAPKGDGVQVTDVKIGVDLEGIYLEMECLFPRNGKCCPKKYLKSCNTILTKTILR